MNKNDQIKSLAIAIEEKDNHIRNMLAQQHNHEVQIAEYRQIVKELTEKLEAYNQKVGSVFVKSKNELNN